MTKEKQRIQNLEEFYNEIRRLVKNTGRTNFVSKGEIEALLVEYKE
jgi:hypothetical protein